MKNDASIKGFMMKDFSENKVKVKNKILGVEVSYSYSNEEAESFREAHNLELEDEIEKFIEGELSRNSSEVVKVKFKRLEKEAVFPVFATKGAACFDLSVCWHNHSNYLYSLGPGEIVVVPTGLACEIPCGYEMQIRSRSGLSSEKGIMVLNSPGTIDSDYRGEIEIILYNGGHKKVMISYGMRIAQAAIRKVPSVEIVEVDKLSDTDRGEGGFGSTGV